MAERERYWKVARVNSSGRIVSERMFFDIVAARKYDDAHAYREPASSAWTIAVGTGNRGSRGSAEPRDATSPPLAWKADGGLVCSRRDFAAAGGEHRRCPGLSIVDTTLTNPAAVTRAREWGSVGPP